MLFDITHIQLKHILLSFQVIAFICGVIVVILMVLALASTDWLMAAGFREGLFLHCIENDAVPPLPFNLEGLPGCYPSRDVCKLFVLCGWFLFSVFHESIKPNKIFKIFSLYPSYSCTVYYKFNNGCNSHTIDWFRVANKKSQRKVPVL